MRRNKIKALIKKSAKVDQNKELDKIMDKVSFTKTKKQYPKLLLPIIAISSLIIVFVSAIWIFKENEEKNTCLDHSSSVLKEANKYMKEHNVNSFYQFSSFELENNYSFYIYKTLGEETNYYYQLFSKKPTSSYKIILSNEAYNLTIYSSNKESSIMGLIDIKQNQEMQISVYYSNSLESVFYQKM